MDDSLDHVTIQRLVGVYDADSTLKGELSYWIKARMGRSHCALCDITHSTTFQKSEWKSCRAALPVPFDTFHRNDQPKEVRVATGDIAPVVVAQTSSGVVTLLGPDDLEVCDGSVAKMTLAIENAMTVVGLRWPE